MKITAFWDIYADTHSEYVIVTALPQQQWLRECASMLCLYIYCLYSMVYF